MKPLVLGVYFMTYAMLFPAKPIDCQFGVDTKIISAVVEDFDGATAVLLKHLNVSLLFHNELFGYDEDVLQLDICQVAANSSPQAVERIIHRKTAFIISIARSPAAQTVMREYSLQTSIPVVQLYLRAWHPTPNASSRVEANDLLHESRKGNGSRHGYTSTRYGEGKVEENYAILVPSFTVMDNVLGDLIPALNITSEIFVIYEKQFEEVNDWKAPYLKLPLPVHFEAAVENRNLMNAQIKQLELTAKNIIMLASTPIVEAYIKAAWQLIEAHKFEKFVVFSKDTLSFKCDECTSADMFWIQVMVSRRASDRLRAFSEFLHQEELDINMAYSIKSSDELQVAYALDIMALAFSHITANHESIMALANKETVEWLSRDGLNSSASLKRLLRSGARIFGEGVGKLRVYEGSNVCYQDVHLLIAKVERWEAEPDAYYYKYMGNWSLGNGLVPYYTTLEAPIHSINHYRIVTLVQDPFVLRKEGRGAAEWRGGIGELDGYCIDLLNLLQQDLNFTYELLLAEGNRFGSIDDNGNWDGMMGALVSGQAEIALGPISVLAERENDIPRIAIKDFTVPFYDLVGTTILMRRADVEYSLFKFLKVLEWPVWLCIAGAYLFTSMLLWIFDKFSPYSYTNNKEKYASETEKREFTLRECLWFCMTSLTPQGGGEAPKNVSGRLVAATWWLFGFIIIASYTANLAAFLTVSRMEQTISSLDDLAKQYKIEYSPLKGGATETYFRRMAEIEEQFYHIWKAMSLNESMSPRERARLSVWDYPVSDKYTNMWRFMQESKLPQTVGEGVARVLNSEKGYAFIGDAMEIKYAVLTNCKLQQVGAEFSRKPYAIAVQTGHPLKEPISASILKLLNERKLETLKEKWWLQNPKRKECPQTEDDTSGISIQNIGGVFIVILAGIGVSLIILFFEYCYYTQRYTRHSPAAAAVGDGVSRPRADGREKVAETIYCVRKNENAHGENNRAIARIHHGVHNGNVHHNVVHYTNTAFSIH